jgi:hypothetical protein
MWQVLVFSSHPVIKPASAGSPVIVSHGIPSSPSGAQQRQAKSSSLITKHESGTAYSILAHVLGLAVSQGLSSPQPLNPKATNSPEQISNRKQSLHIFIFNLLRLLRVAGQATVWKIF